MTDELENREKQEDTIPGEVIQFHIVLFECAMNVFKALLEETGTNRTLEAIRPLNKYAGGILASQAKGRFDLKRIDAEAVAMPYYWCHTGTSGGYIKPMEIRDGKAIVELNFCPTLVINARPEACIAISHYAAEGICEAVNPDYEYIFTHHLSKGDDCCRYVVKKKSDKFSLYNLGRLERTVPVPKLSLEEQYLISTLVCFGQLGIMTSASVGLIGSERTMEVGAPLARETGLRVGNELKGSGAEESGLSTVRDKLDFICSALGQSGTPATITDSSIEKEITDCPLQEYYTQFPFWPQGIPEVCKHLEGVLNGVCEAINPDYEFAYDRMKTKGDANCHWVIKKKAERAKEETKKEAPKIVRV